MNVNMYDIEIQSNLYLFWNISMPPVIYNVPSYILFMLQITQICLKQWYTLSNDIINRNINFNTSELY